MQTAFIHIVFPNPRGDTSLIYVGVALVGGLTVGYFHMRIVIEVRHLAGVIEHLWNRRSCLGSAPPVGAPEESVSAGLKGVAVSRLGDRWSRRSPLGRRR